MQIDVYHDIACPWCRIGKRNLQLALEGWPEPVTVKYHTFFLNPNIPAEGYAFREYMLAKGGGRVPLEQWFDAPRSAGEQVGLVFDFAAITRAPNTLLAHRLIALAPPEQRDAVIDALYAAYFQHGRDIGDIAVLLDIAAAHGMEAALVREQLADPEAQAALLAEAQAASEIGINSVPFFLINNRYAVSGAQPAATLQRMFAQIPQV
jgi:predicted DsbA family dithiol-disulfide isomerase